MEPGLEVERDKPVASAGGGDVHQGPHRDVGILAGDLDFESSG